MIRPVRIVTFGKAGAGRTFTPDSPRWREFMREREQRERFEMLQRAEQAARDRGA